MDVHLRTTTVCILDENGRRVKMAEVRGSWEKVLAELRRIQGRWQVCFEASCGYGWLYERLRKMAEKVVVAHPGQLRLIFRSKRKSDRVDAEKLAKLLYLDEVPPVYVPSVEVRSWRALIEHRQKLLGERTRAKNGLRALLRTHGIAAPRRLWTKKGLAWIVAQELPTAMDRLQRDILLERLGSLGGMLRRVEEALGEIARSNGGVKMLMDIPGVGIRTAEAVMAYVDDPQRFHSIKAAGGYFGLVPCQDQSAGKNRLGHITRQGPGTVRRLLTEASWQGIRRSPRIRAYFERICQGNPARRKIALVATAHYLLRVMLAMLRTGEVWRAEAA
jgi:transposase